MKKILNGGPVNGVVGRGKYETTIGGILEPICEGWMRFIRIKSGYKEISDLCDQLNTSDNPSLILDKYCPPNTPISRQPPFPQSPSQPSIDGGGQ